MRPYITTGNRHRIAPVSRPCAVLTLTSPWMRRRSRSTPAVRGGRVYVQSVHGPVFCLDAGKGEVVWQKEVQPKLPEVPWTGFIREHGYASSTPATDGERVYAFFGKTGVVAFDLQIKADNCRHSSDKPLRTSPDRRCSCGRPGRDNRLRPPVFVRRA